jgi:hypothetical protein
MRMMRKAESVRRPETVRAEIGLERIAEGLANPVFLTSAPGSGELNIVDQIGKIFTLDPERDEAWSFSWISPTRSSISIPITTSADCSGWRSIQTSGTDSRLYVF